jgi:hypothetical protein
LLGYAVHLDELLVHGSCLSTSEVRFASARSVSTAGSCLLFMMTPMSRCIGGKVMDVDPLRLTLRLLARANFRLVAVVFFASGEAAR